MSAWRGPDGCTYLHAVVRMIPGSAIPISSESVGVLAARRNWTSGDLAHAIPSLKCRLTVSHRYWQVSLRSELSMQLYLRHTIHFD